MDFSWIKVSPSLNKGITVINQLDITKFEQFLRRVVAKELHDTEIFTEEERRKLGRIFKINEEILLLSINTVLYLYKRLLKYIFMPVDLKNDLNRLGLSNEKAEIIVKVWSLETRTTLKELDSENVDNNAESVNFSWKVHAELSSDYRKKCKVPKAYLCVGGQSQETEIELTHTELYSVFLQFESIQNELDNIM